MTHRNSVRLVGWLVAVALLALPVVGLFRGWFATSSWPVRTLSVTADYDHVSAARIRATVLPYIHNGFFATRLGDVRGALDRLPWVASASVRKRWPDALVITVRERHPFAHWNADALIDRHGRIFHVPQAQAVTGVPHLSGPEQRVHDVIAFYAHAHGTLASVGLEVTGVHLNRRGGWTLDLAGGGHVVVGRDQPDRRLARFISVYPQLAGTHKESFIYADLRYTDGFAVRWPPATVSPSPSSAKAPHA